MPDLSSFSITDPTHYRILLNKIWTLDTNSQVRIRIKISCINFPHLDFSFFFLIPIMSWISMTCQAGDYYKFKRECEICGQIPTEMQNLRSPSPHHLSNFSPFFPHRKWTSLKWNLLLRPPTFAYLWYNPPDFFYYVSNPNYKNYFLKNNNKVKFLDFFSFIYNILINYPPN